MTDFKMTELELKQQALTKTSCCVDQQLCNVHRSVQAPNLPNSENNYKFSESPKHHLLNLPTEIRLLICENLPLASSCALAFTCKQLAYELAPEFWQSLKIAPPEKDDFLKLLQKELPETFVCSGPTGHHILHNAPQDLQPFRGITFDNFFQCSAALVADARANKLCHKYFRCGTDLSLQTKNAQFSGTVSYEIVQINDLQFLRRKYWLPVLPARQVQDMFVAPAPSDGFNDPVGIQLCQHNTLKCLLQRFSRPPRRACRTLARWTGSTTHVAGLLARFPLRLEHMYHCSTCVGVSAVVRDMEEVGDTHTSCEITTPLSYL
ncbi:hypothetical protein BT63DRAFT_412746 [Microthyrium microscopicum]|uniref:F-box domain-containing protein n=1 Tax=Microthyrium microscopicum TaxID=703497 RepID=A0A6A6UCJ0_9PEZI|nr:hypothetical protein BT63DRAFT_412746 [Microthyrium microscopicum]